MYQPFSNPKNIEKMVREIEVFWEEITLEVLQKPYQLSPFKFVGPWIKYVSAPVKNKRVVYLYWDRIPERISIDDLKIKLQKNPQNFETFINLFTKIYQDYKSYTDKIYRKGRGYYQKLSNKELAKNFKIFARESKKAAFGYYIPYDLEMASEELLKENLVKTIMNKGQREKFVNIISTRGISTFVNEEGKGFLKALIKIQRILKNRQKNWSDKNIRKIVFEQWYDFGLRAYKHGSHEKITLNDYLKKFKKNIELDATKEYRMINQKERKEFQKATELINYYRKYPKIFRYSKWLRRAMSNRNYESDKVNVYFYHCTGFFYEINTRLGIGKDGYLYLSVKEILNGLTGKQKVQKLVKERKIKGFTIKQVGKEIKVITGVNKKDLYEKEITKKITEFPGTVSYKGLVKGKARIVLSPSINAGRFKEGEILVTSMTTPEFAPLIKRAAAIITDEGGLLCHAAIVSRELKTPCIVGTKIATRVLRDGDLVEVDANRGVVKILKR